MELRLGTGLTQDEIDFTGSQRVFISDVNVSDVFIIC